MLSLRLAHTLQQRCCTLLWDEHTAELFLQEDFEVVPTSQVVQQLEEAEGPTLHSHLGGKLNTEHMEIYHSGLWFASLVIIYLNNCI